MLFLVTYSVTCDYMDSVVVVWSTPCSHIFLCFSPSSLSSWWLLCFNHCLPETLRPLVKHQVQLAQWMPVVDSLCLVRMLFFSTITGLESLQALLGHLPYPVCHDPLGRAQCTAWAGRAGASPHCCSTLFVFLKEYFSYAIFLCSLLSWLSSQGAKSLHCYQSLAN